MLSMYLSDIQKQEQDDEDLEDENKLLFIIISYVELFIVLRTRLSMTCTYCYLLWPMKIFNW